MADEDAYVEALTAPSDLRRAIDERDEARAEADALKADAAQAWKSAAHSVRKIQEQRDEAIRERDEARAEARKLDALVFQHREALERIAQDDGPGRLAGE